MKLKTLALIACCLSIRVALTAQSKLSLKDIFNNDAVSGVVDALTQQKEIAVADLEGTWSYAGPACEFESDDLLKKAGGALAASQIEEKLSGIYTKAGITPGKFSYTFNADSTFTCLLGNRTIGGTFSIDNEKRQIVLRYRAVQGLIDTGTVEAGIVLSGDKLQMLFDADKLLKTVSFLANVTKITALTTLSKITEAYDGMRIGFELTK